MWWEAQSNLNDESDLLILSFWPQAHHLPSLSLGFHINNTEIKILPSGWENGSI